MGKNHGSDTIIYWLYTGVSVVPVFAVGFLVETPLWWINRWDQGAVVGPTGG